MKNSPARSEKVKVPKEVWVNVNDQQPGMSHWVCAATEEIAEIHRFKSEKATRYILPSPTPSQKMENAVDPKKLEVWRRIAAKRDDGGEAAIWCLLSQLNDEGWSKEGRASLKAAIALLRSASRREAKRRGK